MSNIFIGMNAWQFLLWIIGLEIASYPLLVGLMNSIIDGYFKAKEKHIGRVAKAVGDSLQAAFNEIKKKSEELELKKKADAANAEKLSEAWASMFNQFNQKDSDK